MSRPVSNDQLIANSQQQISPVVSQPVFSDQLIAKCQQLTTNPCLLRPRGQQLCHNLSVVTTGNYLRSNHFVIYTPLVIIVIMQLIKLTSLKHDSVSSDVTNLLRCNTNGLLVRSLLGTAYFPFIYVTQVVK